MNYQSRKEARTKTYQQKMLMVTHTCVACSGSGRYDGTGSPKCGSCEGSGVEEMTLQSAIAGLPYYLESKASYERCVAASKYGDSWAERELTKINKLLKRIEEKKALALSVKSP